MIDLPGESGSPERATAVRAMMQDHVASGLEWMKQPESVRYQPAESTWGLSWPYAVRARSSYWNLTLAKLQANVMLNVPGDPADLLY